MLDPLTIMASAKALPWKKILIIAGIIVLITGVVTLIKEYGDAQYKAGELAEKQAWLEAEKEYLNALEEAEALADAEEDIRIQGWNDRVAAEQEEIRNAEAEGRSVFDVMFR